jgi:hypothetical protein
MKIASFTVPALLAMSVNGALNHALMAAPTVEAQRSTKGKWQAYPTRTLADLNDFVPAAIPLTKFGGRADKKQPTTGFFHPQKINGRWWLIDPEGGLFIHTGVVSVTSRNKFSSEEPFARLYRSKEKWAQSTLQLLRDNGFNGTGGWSDAETLRAAPQPLPYTVSLSLLSAFGKKLKLTHQRPGHTGYINDCLPVFHPAFAAFCEEQTKSLTARKDDPWLLGYFSDNELPGTQKMLDNMLALDATDPNLAPLREAAQKWLRERKGENTTITDDDRAAFLGYVYDTYLRITTAAIRKADPNHLCLGPRFHGPVRERKEVWQAAGKYLDVVAMNYYGTWTPRSTDMENWEKWSGKPFLITEFYTKGADTPLANSSGAGWIVKTQDDRGWFYQNFALALLESKNCVGWHWFKYMDNDPADLSTDPSNRDSNKGILTTRYEPYTALLEKMKPLNKSVYSLCDYFDKNRK